MIYINNLLARNLKMRIVCPNNREHSKFRMEMHKVVKWKVNQNGEYLETVSSYIQRDITPDLDDLCTCTECGAKAITIGEIVELYATVLEGNKDSYLDIYDNYEDAKKQIGTYVDGVKVIDIKKGYSIVPKGLKTPYDDAPDFCNTYCEAASIANKLNIAIF